MIRQDGLDRLDLDDNFVFDKKIDTVSEWDGDVLVDDWKGFLGFERQPEASEFIAHARVIWLLQQTGTETRMDLVCRAQHSVGDVTMNKIGSVFSVRVRVLRGEALMRQTPGRIN